MTQAERLLSLAQQLAAESPDFHKVKGPGAGDHATNAFMKELGKRARNEFESDYAEQEICGSNGFRVDFYFPDEATIVEVALGLPKPRTEFERDILKAVMAQEAGNRVERLFFISKPGAVSKCSQPGRVAISEWLLRNHGIVVEVHELHPKTFGSKGS